MNDVECLFGAIADDYTGGSDLAGMLRERAVGTVQLFGIPDAETLRLIRGRYQAVVLCLKSRSIQPEEACRQSLAALDVLRALGARQIQFKYCSTFDSTPRGNIGPVADALMTALGVNFTIAVPALPVNGRTQYMGHLFVDGRLLSESPLRHHPLNPMTDSNLVRWLQQQTGRQVGLIDLHAVRSQSRLDGSTEIALVDAIADEDLQRIAEWCVDYPLITGGSGLAMALPAVWRARGWLEPVRPAQAPAAAGKTVILCGSCSAATLGQLEHLAARGCCVIPLEEDIDRVVRAANTELRNSAVVTISSSAPPEMRRPESDAQRIEATFAELARRLVCPGSVGRLIVAGGETSGAIVHALGITAAEVAGIIDPGVPSLRTLSGPPLLLALKSGNFGARDFFTKTMALWDSE